MSDLPMNQEDHPAHDLPEATESYRGASLTDRWQGPQAVKQQQGADIISSQETQDRNDRISNNYQNLYQRSNASSLKAAQQAQKAP